MLTRAELADVDGDSAEDLLVLGDAPAPAVLLNHGNGSFTELRDALRSVPLGEDPIGTVIAPFDLTGDDDIDLLLAETKRTPFHKGAGQRLQRTAVRPVPPRRPRSRRAHGRRQCLGRSRKRVRYHLGVQPKDMTRQGGAGLAETGCFSETA